MSDIIHKPVINGRTNSEIILALDGPASPLWLRFFLPVILAEGGDLHCEFREAKTQ